MHTAAGHSRHSGRAQGSSLLSLLETAASAQLRPACRVTPGAAGSQREWLGCPSALSSCLLHVLFFASCHRRFQFTSPLQFFLLPVGAAWAHGGPYTLAVSMVCFFCTSGRCTCTVQMGGRQSGNLMDRSKQSAEAMLSWNDTNSMEWSGDAEQGMKHKCKPWGVSSSHAWANEIGKTERHVDAPP